MLNREQNQTVEHVTIPEKSYGLFTIITTIVGVVIGSGIYFRADDLFAFTNANLLLGILVLALGALCITFGSLTLSKLALRSDNAGGVAGYFETFMSPALASAYGWFQTFIYAPTISIIVAWAAAIYTFMLLGIEATFLQQIGLGYSYVMFFTILNVLSRKLGGFVQNIATVIKLIPLLLIAFYGIFLADSISLANLGALSFKSEFAKAGWISGLIPMMYSFDGWTFALTLAPELKNAKKNMNRALIISPLIILLVYLLFIFGMHQILGGEAIIALGDSAIFELAKQVFNERLANILLAIIVISVLGVVNGLSLSSIRMPQALAAKGFISSKRLSKIHPKLQVSVPSAVLYILLINFWAIIHYLVMDLNLFAGRDISEISIVFSYVFISLLYFRVFRMGLEEKSTSMLIFSLIAIAGTVLLLIGSLLMNYVYVLMFFSICFLVSFIGYCYQKQKMK